MKRLFVPLVLVLLLALAAQANASTRNLAGNVDPSGTIGFQLKKKKHGPKTIKNLEFGQVPVSCDAGAATTSGRLNFGIKLEGKQFATSGEDGEGSNLEIEGKVKKKGKKASGSIRLFGAVPLDNGTRGANCDTGTLQWGAARV